ILSSLPVKMLNILRSECDSDFRNRNDFNPYMKPYFLTFLFIICCHPLAAQSFLIDDFEADTVGLLPERWYDRDTNYLLKDYNEKVKSTYKYTVLTDNGNQFLRYEGSKAMHINFPLKNRESLDIYKTPVLSWKWRIHDVPSGGNEDKDNRNDVAASVYVVFDLGKVLFRKVPKSIRYTWSTELPVGTELSKFFNNQKIVVVGSGKEGLGEWQSFERNIVEDYKRLFGDDPPSKPLAFLILSDANDTKSFSKADYDEIRLVSANTNN
ncbi:MAG: DUF3047 domain-containing protein, partial [Bacteroidota bacterium]